MAIISDFTRRWPVLRQRYFPDCFQITLIRPFLYLEFVQFGGWSMEVTLGQTRLGAPTSNVCTEFFHGIHLLRQSSNIRL